MTCFAITPNLLCLYIAEVKILSYANLFLWVGVIIPICISATDTDINSVLWISSVKRIVGTLGIGEHSVSNH